MTPFFWCLRDREKILDLFEWASGARLLYNYLWIGGVAHDLPAGYTDKVMEFVTYFEPRVQELNDLLSSNKIFIERAASIGILSAADAISYGIGGPNLRGSGVKWDLRKEEPYGIYDRFDFDVPVGSGEFGPLGSAWDRYIVRVREMLESLKIIRQVCDQMPGGDPNEAMPRRIRPAKGEAYLRTESPRGELGFYLISDGTEKPYRCKARSPCFTAISALNAMNHGHRAGRDRSVVHGRSRLGCMKTTRYFDYSRSRPDRREIRDEWILVAIHDPVEEAIQADGRIRRWTWVEEKEAYLRVILLEDGETVHNAFFDRRYSKKGRE